MNRSQRGDDGLGEVRAVLQRIQRLSAQPDNAEFQTAKKDTSVRSRRIARRRGLGRSCHRADSYWGLLLLSSSRPTGTAMVLTVPQLSSSQTWLSAERSAARGAR